MGDPADELAAAVSILLGSASDSGTVRLAGLAWLIARGLRRTACCGAPRRALEVVEAVFGAAVTFEDRPPENWPDVPYYLGDAVVLYAAESRAELEAVWAEHRVTYTQGVALGRALRYFAPRERFSENDSDPLHVRHYVEGPAGARVELWHETAPEDTAIPALAAHVAPYREAFAAVGQKYVASVEKKGQSLDL